MNQQTINNNPQIPTIKRDGSLVNRLIILLLVGAEKPLDQASRLYIRVLVRLIDKAFKEYQLARECIIEEIKSGDKLANGFNIIDHLENSVNAINRAIKALNILVNGKIKKDKTVIIKNFNLLNFISLKTLEKIKKHTVSKIRNRIEHIDEDIFDNEVRGKLFVSVDDNYKKICVNNKHLTLSDLVKSIEDYHNLVLEILGNLPNRYEDGVYYNDKNGTHF